MYRSINFVEIDILENKLKLIQFFCKGEVSFILMLTSSTYLVVVLLKIALLWAEICND